MARMSLGTPTPTRRGADSVSGEPALADGSFHVLRGEEAGGVLRGINGEDYLAPEGFGYRAVNDNNATLPL